MEAIQVARRLAWLPGRLRWDREVGQSQGDHSCPDREGGGYLVVKMRSGLSLCQIVLFLSFWHGTC